MVTQHVEEVFEFAAEIVELRIGGQLIETTAEHPFFVIGQGWIPARELRSGDRIASHNDQPAVVESVTITDRRETVYNLRVSQDHTYFVGRRDWGFSIWAHNTYTVRPAGDGTFEIIDEAGTVIQRGLASPDDAAVDKNLLDDFVKRIEKIAAGNL